MIDAARFSRIVTALALAIGGPERYRLGARWSFMIDANTDAEVMRLSERSIVVAVGRRSIIVRPGMYRAYEIVAESGTILGETRAAAPAFSMVREPGRGRRDVSRDAVPLARSRVRGRER